MTIKVRNYDLKSSTVLNAIWDGASAEYQSRVDRATADNLNIVQQSIYNYEVTKNHFYNAFDKIALTEVDNMSFENPLSRLKKASIKYGKDTEELFVEMIEGQEYNPEADASELYKRYQPSILSTYYTVNRTQVYPLTIDYTILMRMFTSEDNGYKDTMTALMESLKSSEQVDEFLHFKNMIHGNIVLGNFDVKTLLAITDERTAKDFVIAVKDRSNIYKFPRSGYNKANVIQTCPKTRQVLLLNTLIKGQIDVDVLATSFQREGVEFDIVEIEIDDFGSDGNEVLALLCDERAIKVRDVLREYRENDNGLSLSRNVFQHVHQMFGISPFYNATLFTTVTPTLVSIDLKPDTASVELGGGIQFVVEATGTDNPPSKCTFSVNGNSEKTFLTKTGFLYVGIDETQSPLTVTATSTFLGTITDTATITVV